MYAQMATSATTHTNISVCLWMTIAERNALTILKAHPGEWILLDPKVGMRLALLGLARWRGKMRDRRFTLAKEGDHVRSGGGGLRRHLARGGE